MDYGPGDRRGGGDARLVIIRGAGEGQIHELHGERVRVGRMLDNDVVLQSDTVSRHHAELTPGDQGWAVQDTDSHNGVLHNGYRIPKGQPVTLRNRDTVQLSDVVLLYLAGAMDPTQRQSISTIVIDMKKAESEGEAAIADFLKDLQTPRG